MAYGIHWQIPFKSLRTGILYTVNIYQNNYSGSPVILNGVANPFTTQEADDDAFALLRTQTGYLRIFDDGKAVSNNAEVAFNWKDLLPSTDTDRPVTLTHISGQSTVIDWQGFLQAQNFSGALYGNPQEREFPIQCALSVLQGTDLDTQQTDIKNFAYILQQAVNTVDLVSGGAATDGIITTNGSIHINEIWVQGGADAQQWLMKQMDWQNFVGEDAEGGIVAKYTLFQSIEDMCRFWGWTARTNGRALYLTCPDDASEQTWLNLTRSQLDTLAGGTLAGTTGGSFVLLSPTGDIFANTNQGDYRERGANKATVHVDINNISSEFIEFAPDKPFKGLAMPSQYVKYPDAAAAYSGDLMEISSNFLYAKATTNYATFNLAQYRDNDTDYSDKIKIIRLLKSYDSTEKVLLKTKFAHCYSGMLLQIKGSIYCQGKRLEDHNDIIGIGNKRMYVKLGIGKTRETAKWWNSQSLSWVSQESMFKVTVGNKDDILRPIVSNPYAGSRESTRDTILLENGLSGYIFLSLFGSDDISEWNGQRTFDIEGLTVGIPSDYGIVVVNGGTSASGGRPFAGGGYYGKVDKIEGKDYVSKNTNNVRTEHNVDCIFATYTDDMNYGYGLLINADGTFFKGFDYGGFGVLTYPEQHLADRVTSYWAAAKRKMELELRYDVIGSVTPMNNITIDSTTGHPISISHEWHDDILRLTVLEL